MVWQGYLLCAYGINTLYIVLITVFTHYIQYYVNQLQNFLEHETLLFLHYLHLLSLCPHHQKTLGYPRFSQYPRFSFNKRICTSQKSRYAKKQRKLRLFHYIPTKRVCLYVNSYCFSRNLSNYIKCMCFCNASSTSSG